MIAMKRHGKRERGVAVILAALWLGAITAVAAIAVEVARLTHVATEVQIAADAAALAAAKNLFGGGDQTSATTAGQTVAGKNQADGRLPAPGDVNIEFGKYGVAAGWGSSGDPAVRATVTMTNVKYIMASMLGLGNTGSVQKRAVAMYGCKESGHATAPFTLADCQLAQYTNGQQCSVNNPTLITTTNNTMCWIANNSNDADYLPW